jgi:hypothetical protein
MCRDEIGTELFARRYGFGAEFIMCRYQENENGRRYGTILCMLYQYEKISRRG